MNSTAIRPLGRCHPYYLACSKYLGALAISWNICLLLGQQTVDTICHVNTMVYTCQVLVQLENFIFCHYL